MLLSQTLEVEPPIPPLELPVVLALVLVPLPLAADVTEAPPFELPVALVLVPPPLVDDATEAPPVELLAVLDPAGAAPPAPAPSPGSSPSNC